VAALSPRRPLVWAARAANGSLLRAVDDSCSPSRSWAARRRRPRAVTSIRSSRHACCASSPATPDHLRRREGGLAGFEYRLASAFASVLGVRLEV